MNPLGQFGMFNYSNLGSLPGVGEKVSYAGNDGKGNNEFIKLPCRARGVPSDHTLQTAYFVIKKDTPHGTLLHCSYRTCAMTGMKFRYCSFCQLPVAKRNFTKRHSHLPPREMDVLVGKRRESVHVTPRQWKWLKLLDAKPSAAADSQEIKAWMDQIMTVSAVSDAAAPTQASQGASLANPKPIPLLDDDDEEDEEADLPSVDILGVPWTNFTTTCLPATTTVNKEERQLMIAEESSPATAHQTSADIEILPQETKAKKEATKPPTSSSGSCLGGFKEVTLATKPASNPISKKRRQSVRASGRSSWRR